MPMIAAVMPKSHLCLVPDKQFLGVIARYWPRGELKLGDVMTNRRTGEAAQQVRITCPEHGLVEIGTWALSQAAGFAHSHDEGHGDGRHHAAIEWITDGPWDADPHDTH
jgi:hypothetical protein